MYLRISKIMKISLNLNELLKIRMILLRIIDTRTMKTQMVSVKKCHQVKRILPEEERQNVESRGNRSHSKRDKA